MSELRWALLVLGAVFLAGLAAWELRRARHANRSAAGFEPKEPQAQPESRANDYAEDRLEPALGDESELADAAADHTGRRLPVLNVMESDWQPESNAELASDVAPAYEKDPVGHAVPLSATVLQDEKVAPRLETTAQRVDIHIASETAVDVPGATTVIAHEAVTTDVSIRWPPAELPERVLGLRVVSAAGPLPGKAVRQALLAAGLRPGPQQIFHRVDELGNVLASVANLVRPGKLEPDRMDTQSLRGLSLFAVLPGPVPAEQILDDLIDLARMLAGRLNAHVQDEHGQTLDATRIAELRRAVWSAERGGPSA